MIIPLKLVDCHRHLGGSVSIDFVLHAMEMDACPRLEYNEIERLMIGDPDEPRDFNNFLQKFKFLDRIKWTEQLVADKIKFVCDKMNKEGLSGAFLDFSVSKYRHIGWSLAEAISFILDRLDDYSNIPIIPILSIKYESPTEAQLKIAKVIEKSSIADRVGGIDFVGDEAKFNPTIQRPICEMWDGKLVRLHVGESQPSCNVATSVDYKGVTNIAHGIKIINDPELLSRCQSMDITFDIAPTSNYATGVLDLNELHPGKQMLDNGLRITVGSDDPVIFKIHLGDEYMLLKANGMSTENLLVIAQNGRDQLQRWLKYSVGRTRTSS